MNTRIFLASLFCVAMLGTLPATATVRPEIAQALQDAHRFAQSKSAPPNTFAAMKKIKTAEAVPNQTAEEKQAVARVKAFVAGQSAGLTGDPNFNTPP